MTEPDLYCSFCAASQHDVRALIAGPRVYVCDGCVMLMATILGKQDPRWLDQAVAGVGGFELLNTQGGASTRSPSRLSPISVEAVEANEPHSVTSSFGANAQARPLLANASAGD